MDYAFLLRDYASRPQYNGAADTLNGAAAEIERLEKELYLARNELAAIGNITGERETFEREAARHGNTLYKDGDSYKNRAGSEWYWWKLAWRSALGYAKRPNAKVSGAGMASAGLPGCAAKGSEIE